MKEEDIVIGGYYLHESVNRHVQVLGIEQVLRGKRVNVRVFTKKFSYTAARSLPYFLDNYIPAKKPGFIRKKIG